VDKTNAFLGTEIPSETMAGYLTALEMEVERADGNRLVVTPPPCRVDLAREVDLAEEVARMEGYDRIPVTQPPIRPEDEPDPPEVPLGDRIREVMAGFGFSEVITFSFVSEEAPDQLGAPADSPLRNAVRLLKPLTLEQAVMRTTLLPGLLQSAQTNVAHGERDLKLFEWGKRFLPREGSELPEERLTLAAILTGAWSRKTLHQGERTVDFYDAKGVVEALCEDLGVEEMRFRRRGTPPGFHPERTAQLLAGGSPGGWVGEVSPDTAERFELGPEKAFLVELDIPALQAAMPPTRRFEGYARFPAVLRDLSVVVDAGVESERVRRIIADEKLVESVDIFDLYRGDQIAPSEKALTLRIRFRSPERTLKGREINDLHDKIVQKIERELGGRLRDR
jgi:phenylalanyl-tRNA synthetase beta chain